MNIKIPDFALVVLIGASSSGKTTFAKKHFRVSEVVSSDYCRYLVSDDENNQASSRQAFELLHTIVEKRLELKKLTVVDATNVLENARGELLTLADKYHALTVAIVFNLPDEINYERNKNRTDRNIEKEVIRHQYMQMQYSLTNLKKEGFNFIYILNSVKEINLSYVSHMSMFCDKNSEQGPFDIIGDVHGCYDELVLLLRKLGYTVEGLKVKPPNGRKALFLGDLADRGPKIAEVFALVMEMVKSGSALCIQGNHDNKLYRYLIGSHVQIKNGLEESVNQLNSKPEEFVSEVRDFLRRLESYYVLDNEKLVVAHAGMKEEFIGRCSKKVKSFALYGETTGETDEFGLPVRYLWAEDYRGKALIVYGHTPNMEVLAMNNTVNIDTGCVFGNKLTAFRYPEGDIVSVKALKQYAIPGRPFE